MCGRIVYGTLRLSECIHSATVLIGMNARTNARNAPQPGRDKQTLCTRRRARRQLHRHHSTITTDDNALQNKTQKQQQQQQSAVVLRSFHKRIRNVALHKHTQCNLIVCLASIFAPFRMCACRRRHRPAISRAGMSYEQIMA